MASATSIVRTLQKVDISSFKDEEERQLVRESLHAALLRVQSPWETTWEQVWLQPTTTACLKVCVDLEMFNKWLTIDPSPKNVAELARMVNADKTLMSRLLRHLSAMDYLKQTAVDTYELTPFARELGSAPFSSLYHVLFNLTGPGFLNLPKFLRNMTYENPVDSQNTNFQEWTPDETFFSLLASNAQLSEHFQNAMKIYGNSKTDWTEIYPTDTIVAAQKPGRALVVDVGGGHGDDLSRMRQKHPSVSDGSLILQDLPHVIENRPVELPAVGSAHDFFTPNPVYGARIYYLHMVLHDWSDGDATRILKQIACSMESGYSRVLIHEKIVSITHPSRHATVSDLTMMMCFSSSERSEETWLRIVGDAGLKLVKVWDRADQLESILELELA